MRIFQKTFLHINPASNSDNHNNHTSTSHFVTCKQTLSRNFMTLPPTPRLVLGRFALWRRTRDDFNKPIVIKVACVDAHPVPGKTRSIKVINTQSSVSE